MRTVLLCVLASMLTLTGCQTTSIVVIDSGCETYQRHAIRPSPADTPKTARGLFVLDQAMGAACAAGNV
jgi:hypothetical protein